MSKKTYRVGRPALLVLLLLIIALLAGAVLLAAQGHGILRTALDGRRERAQDVQTSQFSLREQMIVEQLQARVRGWLSIVRTQDVSLTTDRGKFHAQMFAPIEAADDAPWALVLHGGLGTDHAQVQDVACLLSLNGYRVLTPDLYAHGRSEGEIASLGLKDADDVRAWVEWILLEDVDARIVVFGQDEGGVAALLAAADGLPQNVAAVAADSAYANVQARAHELLAEMEAGMLGKWLLDPAYRLAHGLAITEGDVVQRIARADIPLLIIHGTGDKEVLAWQGEDIAAAAGESAQLLLIEGAAHGMARFLEPQTYDEALLSFFEKALGA